MNEQADYPSRTDEEISREAAEWFARLLDESEGTATRHQRFRAWLQEDVRHAKAYAELERLWSGAGMVQDHSKAGGLSRRTVLKAGGTAVVLLAAGFAGTGLLLPAGDYNTHTGEIAKVTFPDGSTAVLSTRTALSLDFTADRRQVTLHRGEAFFEVAPDAARPFSVEASDLSATALGTAYSVGFRDDGIDVTVARHAVRVSTGDTSQQLGEGESLLYRSGVLSSPVETDVDTRLSWRNGKLIFLSTPLEQVVASLSRWRTGKIVVMNERLARSPVTIIVDVKRSDTIIDTLALGLPITVQRLSPWLTFIYPK